ncbi:MAG: 4-hydroxy-tetrahydrodipicolinate reductase [Lysobacterales bacterium]
MKNVAVFGGGKMAKQLSFAAENSSEINLCALVSRNRPDWLENIPYFSSLEQLKALPDLLIDFSLSSGLQLAAYWCRSNLVPLLSGTTGHTQQDRVSLLEAAELVPVLWAPNLSKGLNLVLKAVIETAVALPPDTPVEILDIHHIEKKDAPSGTALLLAQAIASARHQELDKCLNVIQGEGKPEYARGSINCISRREGEVIGEHHVRFMHSAEQLRFSHVADNRNIYAQGALEAGIWLTNQSAGLYTANDWLSP